VATCPKRPYLKRVAAFVHVLPLAVSIPQSRWSFFDAS
jgi:hypothetical protein